MPVPGYGQEKRLGKIRAELSSGGYGNAPYSSAPTKLDEAENGEYGTINTTTLPGTSPAYPVPSNPAAISEWDNYDHTLAEAIEGCMDGGDTAFGVTVGGVPAENYNPEATIPEPCTYIEGCSDPNASNYNAQATLENGSCIAVVNGCTNASADNYNPNANTDDLSCVQNLYGCADPLAETYAQYALLEGNLLQNYAEDGIIQYLYNDPDLCTYAAVIVDGDIDNDGLTDLYVGLNPVGFTFSSELDNPGFTGSPTNPNLEVGLSTSFQLLEIVYGGGPANFIPDNIVTFGASSVNFTLVNNEGTGEGNSFIRKIIVFVSGATNNNPGGNFNLTDGTPNGQGQSIVMYNGETGNYLSGTEGGYVNGAGAVSTYAMVQDYGGTAYLRILTEPLYGTDDLNSVFANTDNQYTSDDSNIGYFRQVYFKFHWSDMTVDSESQDNIYQPTCHPACDPPAIGQFFGCVEMNPSGDSNDENDYDCPANPFEMLWPVKQVFAQIEATSDDGDSTDDTEDDNSTTADENDTSSAGGGRPSDARWKKNIKRVGTSKLGLPIFEFEYIDSNHGEGKWIGTIAQELIKKDYAHATNKDKNGFYSVDYDKIDIEFKSNKKEDK